MEVILQVMGIHRTYKDAAKSLHILKGIDLHVKQGEVVSIVGPSGAGKSTLLHIMGGLDAPDHGQVILSGQDIYALKDAQRAKVRNTQIGFVFQFYHLLAEFTALENVILPLCVRDRKFNQKKFKEKGVKILEQVGLGDRIGHKPNQLSGGEQQRVAIARALINETKVLLCDEPTGNLDSDTGREIINLLMKLNAENKQTLIIVTHDDAIAQLSHRSIRMCDGKLQTKER